MLTITIPATEHFDNKNQEFISESEIVLELEHSLVALSKWESIHEKPFLTEQSKSPEEIYSYIDCMILTPNIPRSVLMRFTEENLKEINGYLNSKQSATWFTESAATKKGREVITSELIYYWMTGLTIPFQPAETWHLNRLFTLIKVCNLKNSPAKKSNTTDAMAARRELNARRKAQLGTTG